MKRINKNGFTMVEILATLVILSIVSVIVLFSVRTLIEKSHKSYYDGEEKMIVLSAQTYFSDYKSKLPKEVGGIEKVTLQTLMDEKYIDPVYNHNKEACFYDQSFVYAQKSSDENYQYYTYLSCPDYNKDVDQASPMIKFNPNKGLSNKNIEVKMEITDNKNINSYQYIVLKNDVEVENSSVLPYTSNPTITLTEDGVYQIIGYAWDEAGNKGTKTSGKYEIKKTGPNCSNIIFNIDKTPEKWTTGRVNLTIQVPEDTQRWTWSTRNALTLSSSTSYGKAKQYLGTSSQTVSFTKDGQNQGKIVLYDKVGNQCSIETARYFLWNTPPTFSDFTITSTVREYNAVTTKLTIPASNPPGLPMQMYISNGTTCETGGSWESYAPTKNWNVGGTMDGGTRTVCITIRDSLGNKKNIKKTYKVYHECTNTTLTQTYGQCRAACGGGTQDQTSTYRDKLTNKVCRVSVNSNYLCNTMDCCSSTRENLGGWSACDQPCGGGHSYQSATYTSIYDGRLCRTNDKANSKTCNTQSCALAVRTESVTGGSISVASTATPGSTVNFTPNPIRTQPGYAIDTRENFTYAGARIKDANGNVIKTLSASETSFTMPNHAVTIRPKWKKDDYYMLNLDGHVDDKGYSGWGNFGATSANPSSMGGWGGGNNMLVTQDLNRHFVRFNSDSDENAWKMTGGPHVTLGYFHTLEFSFNEWGGNKPNTHATCYGSVRSDYEGYWKWPHTAAKRVSANSGANNQKITMKINVSDINDNNTFYAVDFEVQNNSQQMVVDLTHCILRGNLYE